MLRITLRSTLYNLPVFFSLCMVFCSYYLFFLFLFLLIFLFFLVAGSRKSERDIVNAVLVFVFWVRKMRLLSLFLPNIARLWICLMLLLLLNVYEYRFVSFCFGFVCFHMWCTVVSAAVAASLYCSLSYSVLYIA